ncbi:putative X protein [human papillomavirus 43]|uniref:Putative X protein n=1 Tax=Human papillomavirus 43 TaxID=10591 RepID=Q705H2_HPV43|nr:putative X protein [human papillomavirus 43]CAD1814283.1 putative X protein [human papillomavirus 43]CAF05791.1 putative X protein [human papillomavirus 43]
MGIVCFFFYAGNKCSLDIFLIKLVKLATLCLPICILLALIPGPKLQIVYIFLHPVGLWLLLILNCLTNPYGYKRPRDIIMAFVLGISCLLQW